jgi:predicted extracellular nuclease
VISKQKISALLALAAFGTLAGSAHAASLQITEWMYQGLSGNGEFIEFTNMGPTAINMTGWSFDDDSRVSGTVSLSGFGIVESGRSVILTESSAAAFRAAWGLSADVAILGGNSTNLGRADEINLFDNTGALIDRLTYGDQSGLGPRTQGKSANPHAASDIGSGTGTLWVLSAIGDAAGSWTSTGGDIANPGTSVFAPAPVPVPAAAWLLVSGLGALAAMKKRRKA